MRSVPCGAVLVALALLTLACDGSHPRVETPRLGRGAPAIDLQTVAATMAHLRGVTYDRPIGIHTLDEAAFVQRVHVAHRSGSEKGGGRTSGLPSISRTTAKGLRKPSRESTIQA